MKPMITENQNYNENGEYIERPSPQHVEELLERFEQRSAEFYRKFSLPYAPVLGDKSWMRDYLIPPIKGDHR